MQMARLVHERFVAAIAHGLGESDGAPSLVFRFGMRGWKGRIISSFRFWTSKENLAPLLAFGANAAPRTHSFLQRFLITTIDSWHGIWFIYVNFTCESFRRRRVERGCQSLRFLHELSPRA